MEARGLIVPSRIVGSFFLVTAVVAASFAVWFYASTAKFLKQATATSGMIVRLIPSANDGNASYSVEYEFSDTNGVTHRSIANWSSNPPAYAVGEKVEVLYPPADPASPRLRHFADLWLGAVICGLLTLVPLVLAIAFIWLIPFTIRRVWPIPHVATA